MVLLIGTGQRYHVIVEAKPSNDIIPLADQNYWIRAVIAQGCGGDRMMQPHPQIGIIRYSAGSTKTPTTKAYQFSTKCSDEPYESLVPLVPRIVGAHANNRKSAKACLEACNNKFQLLGITTTWKPKTQI